MDFSFKNYKAKFVIPIAIGLSLLIDYLITNCLVPLLKEYVDCGERIIRIPGNATIIGSIFVFYDKVLWKIWGFKELVNVPNLNGRFRGKINYVFDEKPGETECAVEIKQTASKIKIHCYFKGQEGISTDSISLVENVVLRDDDYHLYLFYLNSGSKEDGSLDSHEGANYLKVIGPNHKKLKGHYFTNRLKQTKGRMEVNFETKKLKGEF